MGSGTADAVPAAVLSLLAGGPPVLGVDISTVVGELLPVPVRETAPDATLPDGATVVAPDPVAHRLALRYPGAVTVPDREVLRGRAIGAEVAALTQVGAHLRRECPWDREQTAATIVPHTIEEAFEVAEAVASDGIGLPDELGDLLFQSVFLSQLLEEEGTADLASVARGQIDKLVSRHPHVYGEEVAATAAGVIDVWERRKRAERADQGIFHDLPAGLPALAYATKAQKRAASVGFTFAGSDEALAHLDGELARLRRDPGPDAVGAVLLAMVAVARMLGADPELALRAAAGRFRRRVERAEAAAAAAGEEFERLSPADQRDWYRRTDQEAGP